MWGYPRTKSVEPEYGVSSARLALILGFGENQISNYIDGEVPNKANGKTLSAIKDPRVFRRYVELAKEQLKPSVYEKLMLHVDELVCSYSLDICDEPMMVAEDSVKYGE